MGGNGDMGTSVIIAKIKIKKEKTQGGPDLERRAIPTSDGSYNIHPFLKICSVCY